ncbi:hypothetical protein [Noviherbaspirillum massiliense]|uniref:hypothetical protein n=1 Tax=Noviherbaspirillum massiliense TaxID=1465823 RepID=UPI000305E42E|nr:hypothetical protein [Noviherbaspirillum massiliense]
MRFDLHLREVVKRQISEVAQEMKAWETDPTLREKEREAINQRICFFEHTKQRQSMRYGGVDGSGDFPALTYADCAVYFTVAQGVVYESTIDTGLKELPVLSDPVVHVTWIPEHETKRKEVLLDAFAYLAGSDVKEVIAQSDYMKLRATAGRRSGTVDELFDGLILPHPTDAGNLGIQLRTTAEMGAALRLICSDQRPNYVLVDTTMSLPLVTQSGSLFFEHLKRLCCVEATKRGIGFFALSKSHGLPSVEQVDALVRDKAMAMGNSHAEHWFIRLPIPNVDPWAFPLPDGKRVPPYGAVSYLVRFHRNTPIMRLDVDFNYWQQYLRGSDYAATSANEAKAFGDLDYASHDQRAFGYPYPIKACHDRTSMKMAERVALRKQIIDAAVAAGMKRTLFKDVSIATGHA